MLTQVQSKELGSYCRVAGLSEQEVQTLVLTLKAAGVQMPWSSEIYAAYRLLHEDAIYTTAF